MKQLFLIIFFCHFFFLNVVSGQSNFLTLEYFPNISGLNKIESLNSAPKFSQSLSAKYHIPITSKSNFIAGIEISNTGFKTTTTGRIDTTTIGGNTINLAGNTTVFNYNLFNINIGHSFNFNGYFLSTEAGLGFLLNTTQKTKKIDNQGQIVGTRSNFNSQGGFQRFTVPFALFIGKRFETFGSNALVGVKGYYALSKEKYNADNVIGFWGVGLVVGYIIE